MRCENPVSWLRLERYHLGEAPAPERARVDEHLAGCAACRSNLDSLAADGRPLPELPAVLPRPRRHVPVIAGVFALAAAALLAVLVRPGAGLPPPETTWKGGDLAITLDRERDGAVQQAAGTYRGGDRFLVRLTAPPGSWAWDVVVFEGGLPRFPYAPAAPFPGGNQVPLPGAFTPTGAADLAVCAVVGSTPPSREALAAQGAAALQDGDRAAVCAQLKSAR